MRVRSMNMNGTHVFCMEAKRRAGQSPSRDAGLVIGDRDVEAGNVSVRLHGKGNLGAKPKGEVIADILAAIRERRR